MLLIFNDDVFNCVRQIRGDRLICDWCWTTVLYGNKSASA